MTINVIRTLSPLQVEIKTAWADEWEVKPNVEPISGSAGVGAIGEFSFRLKYGQVKYPLESSIGTKDYTEIARDWIRVKKAPYGSDDILFMGRIESDNRKPTAPTASNPGGTQIFTAYDGTQILNKTVITRSIYKTGASSWADYDTLLPFNLHPNGRTLIKNRSDTVRSSGGIDHHTFMSGASAEFWTVGQAIKYLIAEFVGGSGDPAVDPLWVVTIPEDPILEVEYLQDILEPMSVPPRASLIELLNMIIGKKYGWVWVVVPTANGFNLKLSTISATEVEFEGVKVPANPDVVNVNLNDPNVIFELERSQVQSYGKIRVIGNPMVVVRSFDYVISDSANATMDWTEVEDENEDVVSASFIGKLSGAHWTAARLPLIDDDGTLDTTTMGPIPVLTPTTMTAIPVKIGVDYDVDGAPDPLLESDYQPPMLIYGFTEDLTQRYSFYTDENSASLYSLPTDVGVQMKDYPEGPTVESWHMTVAFQAAQRIEVSYSVPGASASDGEFVIEVPDAECWYLAQDMIYGILKDDVSGDILRRLDNGIEIRNDREKLYRVMAGAIARYVNARSKAVIGFYGLWAYQENLGQIFGAAADATDIATIAAPITAVQWQFEGDFKTTVSTGFSV